MRSGLALLLVLAGVTLAGCVVNVNAPNAPGPPTDARDEREDATSPGTRTPPAPPAEPNEEPAAEPIGAAFAAKAVDLPGGDTDTTDDAMEITFASGAADLAPSDVEIFVDGEALTWNAAQGRFVQGPTLVAGTFCSTGGPGGSTSTWARGASLHIVRNARTSCSPGDAGDMDGVHVLKVVVRGQTLLDTAIEVHDNAAS